MNHPLETYRGEHYFQNNQLLYINRAAESIMSPYHDHDFLECVYITEGEGYHHIGDQVHKVRKGQVFFIPIGISHVFRPLSSSKTNNPLSVFNCVFSPLLLHKLNAFASDYRSMQFIADMEGGRCPYYSCMDTNDQYEKLFLAMHREFELPRTGSADYLHSLLLQLLIMLQRSMEDSSPEPAPRQTAFSLLLNELDQHYGEELTLTKLAMASGWSERHLQRLFLQYTKQSFHRYLQNIRIQKSQELLRGSTLKISMIAEMVGYKDIHSFNALFKRCTGMTPSVYRKESTAAESPVS
ncbi:AraC family L-rhamnose operon transcriptional activator RhaR [Paenibacillus endophyticus]|uniref:AraC family L-rhamnose operon transcriptional activator RhaR n=1 Tax=Paenibacillus endophyticus TaxID=1294268 RepID=A0A7W5GDJ6_9BACL|nr:helix-turn-helix domain-containing protein [Paenibacillus endophyticus]MBB3155513.1 AraC family L-rhamnose operon transcriptional activator RhaR [Paenibacillus endophyticus]